MPAEPLMTPQQVADFLNVSVAAVQNWARNGELPFVRVGRKLLRFHRSEVEIFAGRPRAGARNEPEAERAA